MSASRSHCRYHVALAATLEVAGEHHEVIIDNMSLGGAFVLYGARPRMGQPVTLRLRVPSDETLLEIAAQVRWSTDSGIGLRFDGLRAKVVWALGKYFDSLPA